MKIIFVRHGETVYNSESRYQGHTDTGLSDLGHLQATAVAERLKREKVDAVYASDLRRAVDTASAIASFHGLTVRTDPNLRECAFGDWEGLTVSEIRTKYPDLYANYTRDSVTHRAPNGERLEELQERVVRSIEEIAERHPKATVVAVVHGGPIRAFVCHALGADLFTFRKIHLNNCGITVLKKQPGSKWLLELLNEACHLEALKAKHPSHDETSR